MIQPWRTNHVNKHQFNTMAHKNERQLEEVVQSLMCVKTKGILSSAIFYHVYLTGSSSM